MLHKIYFKNLLKCIHNLLKKKKKKEIRKPKKKVKVGSQRGKQNVETDLFVVRVLIEPNEPELWFTWPSKLEDRRQIPGATQVGESTGDLSITLRPQGLGSQYRVSYKLFYLLPQEYCLSQNLGLRTGGKFFPGYL